MRQLILQPTAVANWYAAINEAEQLASLQLPHQVESYIVMMLQRFVTDQSTLQEPVALEFLTACQAAHTELRKIKLQHVGDQCLMLTGLFPQKAEARQVTINYYIEIGQTAYAALHQHDRSDLFQQLCSHFIDITKVLSELRQKTPEASKNLEVYLSELINQTRH